MPISDPVKRKEYHRFKSREWYLNNLEKCKAKSKSRADWNKEYLREKRKNEDFYKKEMIDSWIRRGIIADDWNEIYNIYSTEQNCWCCNKLFITKKDKNLDHDHKTGEIRAILCTSCNVADRWIKLTEI
tara:strand:+ start:864 stop:1250 length:387 start_codon:yes stop_codon:yes gene_type:complete